VIYAIKCVAPECDYMGNDTLLEENFAPESIDWTDKDGNAYTKTSECDGVTLVGGYNNLAGGSLFKTYENLPTHTHIFIAIEVWFIDSWDNEDFTISVDQVPGITTTKGKGEWAVRLGNVCGNPNYEWTEEVKMI
jgi:hypothetical protein